MMDKRIPEGEDLPLHQFQEIMKQTVEIQAMRAQEIRCSTQLREQVEARDLKAQNLAMAEQPVAPSVVDPSCQDDITLEQLFNQNNGSQQAILQDDAHIRAHIQQGYLQN
ncbi:hypothetical protein C0993_002007 [Termitomyces sp. T159_Od127]|nr:hypothetical protein C0993_002007 [Termitomyces sp. T159_Od127]